MIDHHVDRPDVEARRRAKLTGPNRPTGSRSTTIHSMHPSSGQSSVTSGQEKAGMAGHSFGTKPSHERARSKRMPHAPEPCPRT